MSSSTFIYSPTRVNRNVRVNRRSSTYAPSNSRENSQSISTRYAPTLQTSNYRIVRYSNDYSPSVSTSTYYDYSPTNYRSTSFKEKYAPYDYYQYFLRYAPTENEDVVYAPSLVSRYRPHPIIISNRDTLNDYYVYLVNLLRALR